MRGSPSGPQRATFDTTRDSCRSSWRRAQALRSRTRRTREPSRLHHGHRHAERTRPTRSVRPNFLALSKGAERVASARGRVVFAGGCVLTILYLDIDGEGVMVRCWLVRCPDQASPGIGSALLARDHARAGRRRRPRLSRRVCRARCAPRSLACRRGGVACGSVRSTRRGHRRSAASGCRPPPRRNILRRPFSLFVGTATTRETSRRVLAGERWRRRFRLEPRAERRWIADGGAVRAGPSVQVDRVCVGGAAEQVVATRLAGVSPEEADDPVESGPGGATCGAMKVSTPGLLGRGPAASRDRGGAAAARDRYPACRRPGALEAAQVLEHAEGSDDRRTGD